MELKYLTWGARSYFVVVDDDVQVAEIEVSDVGDSILTIDKTEVYDSEKGRGIDIKLVQHLVQYARENNLKLRPLCAYFRAAIAGKPSVQDVIVSSYLGD